MSVLTVAKDLVVDATLKYDEPVSKVLTPWYNICRKNLKVALEIIARSKIILLKIWDLITFESLETLNEQTADIYGNLNGTKMQTEMESRQEWVDYALKNIFSPTRRFHLRRSLRLQISKEFNLKQLPTFFQMLRDRALYPRRSLQLRGVSGTSSRPPSGSWLKCKRETKMNERLERSTKI